MKVLSIDRVRFGAFEFDRLNRLLYREGAELSLPPRAIAVLSSLIDRPGQIVPKQVLLDEVWKDANVTETSLTEAISLLRQALSDDPQRPAFIQTVPRRGYRFVAPAEFVDSDGNGHGERVASSGSAERVWPSEELVRMPAVEPSASASTPASTSGAAAVSPVTEPSAASAAVAPTAGDATWPAWLPWLFLGVTLIAFTGILMSLVRQPSTYARPVVRFAVDVPAGLRLVGDGPAIAVSRDGRRVAFVARRADGPARIYVRDMDRLDPIGLDGTDGAAAPFFSPDARWVGFFAGGSLKKILVGGGPAITLCAARVPLGAVWSARRVIIFAASLTGGLSRVHEDGGRPATLTTPDPDEGEARHAWPDILPDETGVIFTGVPLNGGPEASRIAAVTFDGGHVQTLVSAGVSPHYVPTGHLLFARNRTVFAAPFDPDARELLGPALPVLDDVVMDDAHGVAQFATAPGGHSAVVRIARPDATAVFTWIPLEPPAAVNDERRVTRADHVASERTPPPTTATRPTATARAAPFSARDIRGLSLSPDGTRLAVSLGDGHRTDIWISDLARGDLQRLTSEGQNVSPIWTPDSRHIVYASHHADGPFALMMKAVDEPAASSIAMHVAARQSMPVSASTAGLVYVDAQPSTGLDLWLMPWTGAPARPLVRTAFDDTAGAISPDGHWLAYQSNDTGSWMVMLRPVDLASRDPKSGASVDAKTRQTDGTAADGAADGAGGGAAAGAIATRLAPSDGSRLAWSRDGQSILFTHDGELQRITLPASSLQPTSQQQTSSVAPPAPRTLASDIDAASGFGVTPDGRVFVRTRDDASATPARFEVVLDWSRELSARVPIRPRPPKPVR